MTTSYLHVACGPYELLLDGARVREVWQGDGGQITAEDAGRDHCWWRDRVVPLVRGRLLLGVSDPGPDDPVLVAFDRSEGGEAGLLLIDRVCGLVRDDDVVLQAPPALPPAAARLIDGVCWHPAQGRHLYRLVPAALTNGCGASERETGA